MSKELITSEKSSVKQSKAADKAPDKQRPAGLNPSAAEVLNLQQKVGNQAVQRLIAQRDSGESGFDLDEGTASRINRARGSGQSLDSTVQKQMGSAMGHDFSGVRVHTSSESDTLNQQLNAKAFTTGQDIFFKQGEYNPGSSGGQELIAHELTHVVQQGSGQVGGSGGGMTVRPAGDAFEQEADATARQAVQAGVQMRADDSVQRQEVPEEEEEAVQAKALQRQDEEEVQAKFIQRQPMEEEEEMLQPKSIQRQEVPEEEEEVQTKPIQRQEELPEEEVG